MSGCDLFKTSERHANMPIIQIHMMEGRTAQQKDSMIEAITAAVASTLGVRTEQVRILIDELKPEHFAVGGQTAAQKADAAAMRQSTQLFKE